MEKLAIIEGLLFLSGDEGVSILDVSEILEISEAESKALIENLIKIKESPNSGMKIEYLGEKYKLTTKEEHSEIYKKLIVLEDPKLSDSALETLAIIAYNEPITRVLIDEIRGVSSAYIVRKLLIKGLIDEDGRSDSPGRPMLYKTSSKFLDYFGLSSKDELPEIKEIEEDLEDLDLFESKYKEE